MIAELVAEGIGMSVLPERMVMRLVAEGSIQLIATDPSVADGRLHVVSRSGIEDAKVQAITATITRVLQRIGYLRGTRL